MTALSTLRTATLRELDARIAYESAKRRLQRLRAVYQDRCLTHPDWDAAQNDAALRRLEWFSARHMLGEAVTAHAGAM